MNEIIIQITHPDNLYLAWEQAKYCYKTGDIWFDEIEVARFEANLKEEIEVIQEKLRSGKYKMSPLKPVAFPKAKSSEKGTQNRQSFWVSIADQIAWLAVVNSIGPSLDYRMPFWSYGNRLYIPVFYELNSKGKKSLKFGWYRHTTKNIYRKWNHSWPLFRRHLAITARIMANIDDFRKSVDKFKEDYLENDIEKEILEQNSTLRDSLKVKYLEREYWDVDLSKKVYCAGIDLEKFYPNVNLDVIFQNFEKYFPRKKNSEELKFLLKCLLEFPLDLKGWEQEELKAIQLEPNQEKLEGLPTGLFVSGFLANLAMLAVDHEVIKKMEQEKNVTHFRFVDDHVILADNFESLVARIEWYTDLLVKFKVGPKINISKTEPESLGKYLNNKDNNDLHDKSERDSAVDPNFPTPLMTQTLAKVSQIAQTEFELLDIDEENQLISDIEHLLLVDFPDQELRKDTRVSFAATMLSRIVPNKHVDFTNLIKIEEEIFLLKEELLGLNKKSRGMAKKDERIKEIKERIQVLTKEFRRGEEDADSADERLRKHTSKLLLQAIRKNHDKRRLWTRFLEFCLRMGASDLKQILQLVDQLSESAEINSLSAEYLKSIIFQILSDQLFKCYFTLRDVQSSQVKIQRTRRFLKGIVDKNFLVALFVKRTDREKFYYTFSRDSFEAALGSVLYLLIQEDLTGDSRIATKYSNIISRFNLINWFQKPQSFVQDKSFDFGSLAWWLVNKTSQEMPQTPHRIWYETIKELPLTSNTNLALLALFPKNISFELLKKIDQSEYARRYFDEEGWIYDVLHQMRADSQKLLTHQNWRKQTVRIINIVLRQDLERITLVDWIIWTKKRLDDLAFNNNAHFDPRLSEWTSLEIVLQIAELLEGKVYEIPLDRPEQLISGKTNNYYKIHPANYLVSNKWITPNKNLEETLTWEVWGRIVCDSKVQLQEEDYLIKDSRYTHASFDVSGIDDDEGTVVNGLAVLLVNLLAKSKDFPLFWNPKGLRHAPYSLAQAKLQETAVSSRTNSIIQSCFSKRNKETVRLRNYQPELYPDPDDDTVNDPPEIITIKQFIDHIKFAQKVLKKYQLTVQEHQPRELIPINLIQLAKHNFYQINEEDNDHNSRE